MSGGPGEQFVRRATIMNCFRRQGVTINAKPYQIAARMVSRRSAFHTLQQLTDTQSTDTQSTDTQSTDTQSTDTQSTDTQSTDTQSTDTQSTCVRSLTAKLKPSAAWLCCRRAFRSMHPCVRPWTGRDCSEASRFQASGNALIQSCCHRGLPK